MSADSSEIFVVVKKGQIILHGDQSDKTIDRASDQEALFFQSHEHMSGLGIGFMAVSNIKKWLSLKIGF